MQGKLVRPIQRNPRGLYLAQARKMPVMEAGTRIDFEPVRHSPMDHGRSVLGKGQNNVTGKGCMSVSAGYYAVLKSIADIKCIMWKSPSTSAPRYPGTIIRH